jgi:hypothetical protein
LFIFENFGSSFYFTVQIYGIILKLANFWAKTSGASEHPRTTEKKLTTYNLHLTDILAVGHQRQATVLDAEGDAEDEGLPVAEFDPETCK